MAYKIFITIDAAEELEKIIQYLIEKKRNPQAATSLLNDFVFYFKTKSCNTVINACNVCCTTNTF